MRRLLRLRRERPQLLVGAATVHLPERVGGSWMSECTVLREGWLVEIERLARQALAFACGGALFPHVALSVPDSGMIAASVVRLFLEAPVRKTH